MTEAIGWISSILLVLTISHQVWKQWQEGTSEGVSKWLFVGQIVASIGFILYSWLLGNRIFIITNTIMLFNAILGLSIVLYHRRKEQQ